MADRPRIPFRKGTLAKRTLLSQKSLAAALGGKDTWEIDSKGYLARVNVIIGGSETTSTADPVATGDWPWALFNRINVRDSSGGMLKNGKGYSLAMADKWFQPWAQTGRNLASSADTRIYTVAISAVQANNIRFCLNLPVECNTRDNMGLVPNQNASFKYTLDIDWETEANLVTTAANSAFALTAQPEYFYYTVPNSQRRDGAEVQTLPPFAGVVRQVWDESKTYTATGVNRFDLQTGRVIRNLLLVSRNSSGVRQASNISRIALYAGDDQVLFDLTDQALITEIFRLYGIDVDTGVYPIPFTADLNGFIGADGRRDYLDTRNLTNLYLNITTTASSIIDLVHDELIVPFNMSV